MNDRQVPVLVEILVAREDDAAMGTAIDAVREFEPAAHPSPDVLAGVPKPMSRKSYRSAHDMFETHIYDSLR